MNYIMRIPNASPTSSIVNFETKCKDFFHPRVLEYILRNELARLSRQNSYLDIAKNPRGALYNDLMRLSSSLVSCASSLKPQTVATVFLAFAKLEFLQQDVYKTLCTHFDVNAAKPKSLALIYNSLARAPKAICHVPLEFWHLTSHRIASTLKYANGQDIATFAISIPGILVANQTPGFSEAATTLKQLHFKVLETIKGLLGHHIFTSFELKCILQSILATKQCNVDLQSKLFQELKTKIPLSPNAITETIVVLDLLPAPNLSVPNKQQRFENREIARIHKDFVQWALDSLLPRLEYLTPQELGTIAATINRLRIWSNDDFALEYAKQWRRHLSCKPSTQNLVHAICYFLRRYETSVARELALQTTHHESWLKASKVSNECGKIGEALVAYAKANSEPEVMQRINDIIKIATNVRATRAATRKCLETHD